MALIVETGAGLPNADSFISVEDADEYFSARGITLWATLQVAEKEQALRRATDFMERRYGAQWAGQRLTLAQALSWPRVGVVFQGWTLPSDDVPQLVVKACAELGFRAAGGELDPDLGAQVKSETVGPISTTYADGARQQVKYQAIDAMLGSLVSGGGNMVKLIRA